MKPTLIRAVLLAGACMSCPALAQDVDPADPAPAADAASADNIIVITGTRVLRSELDFANPVVSVTAAAIQDSGYTNLADLLVESPALLGSTTGALTGGSFPEFGESGLDLLNLRNLGSERTLVLVDGRRHVAAQSGSAAVDINAIPTDLVEAVDVLTGGASAIYGADGVSGVVNFRLKHDFEGLTARGQYGRSKYGDGDNIFGAVTFGQNFSEGRGNFAIAYEYSKDKRVSDQDRPWLRNPVAGALFRNQDDLPDDPNNPDLAFYDDVRYADSSPYGAVDVDFDYAADFEGNGNVYDRGLVLEESGGYTQGGSSTPIDGYQGDLFPGIERHLVNALGQYEFSEALTLFAEGKYVHTRTRTLAQPTYDFYAFQTAENPFMPQAIRDAIIPGAAAELWFSEDSPDGVIVTRDNYDLGVNMEDVTRETWRSVVGAKGRLSDHLTYELSYVYGQTKSTILSRGNRLEAQWQAAIDVVEDPDTGLPVCRSSLDPDADPELAGCVPYNIFGEHVQDQAAIDFVTFDSLSRSKVTQHVVSGSLSGDTGGFFELPGGPVGYALGAEYRKESSSFDPDPAIAAGLTWQGAVQPEAGSFNVKEVFAEVNLPILKDVPGAYLLSFGGAFRLSDYSTIGSTTTWKVDGVWAPIPDISLRGTYSQAVRAPNIGELFGPASTSYNYIVDPCDTQETNNGTSSREANCAALLNALGVDPTTFSPSSRPEASVYTEGLASGNRDLQEETATTWTAGVVLRPTFLRGFTASFDWYDIKIKDAINTAEAQDLAELCVDQPTLDNQFCPGIERDEDGYIVGFNVMPANVAQFRTAGLDVSLGYRLATDTLGTFDLLLVGNYLDRLEFVSSPGADVDSDAGEIFYPKYSATLDLTWKKGAASFNYGINWFSKTDRFTAEQLAGDPDYADPRYFKIKEKWQHDVQVGYTIADTVEVYAGVQNIFDQRPVFDYTYYPISGMGRFFYGGITVTLGPVF
jgi:outer membrane receptor protein involved in Fe transport